MQWSDSDSDALLSFDAFHIVKFLANISIKPTESNASLLLLMHQSVISNSSDSQQPAARLVDSRMVDMPHVVFGGALKRLQIEQSSHHVILWWLAISQICWSDCWSDRGFADGSALWVSVLKGQWFKTAKDNTWCVECHMLCLVGSWNDYKENKAVW